MSTLFAPVLVHHREVRGAMVFRVQPGSCHVPSAAICIQRQGAVVKNFRPAHLGWTAKASQMLEHAPTSKALIKPLPSRNGASSKRATGKKECGGGRGFRMLARWQVACMACPWLATDSAICTYLSEVIKSGSLIESKIGDSCTNGLAAFGPGSPARKKQIA